MKDPQHYGFAGSKALRYAEWKTNDPPPLWWIQLLVVAPSDQARAYLLRHPVGDTPPEWWVDKLIEFTGKRPLALHALIDLLNAPTTTSSKAFYESLAGFLIERGHLTYQQAGGQYGALMRNYDALVAKRDAKARSSR